MRLKAFTIWELIVVMVVGSIAIILTTGIYFTIQDYQRTVKRDYTNGTELLQLKELLETDLEYADKILMTNNNLLFEGSQHPVNYHFDTDFIIRKENSRTDTFFIQTRDLEISSIKEYPRFLSTIEFNTTVGGLLIPVFLVKEYENQKLYQATQMYEYRFEKN